MKYNLEAQLKEVNKIIQYWKVFEENELYPLGKEHAHHNVELYESIKETLLSVKEKK